MPGPSDLSNISGHAEASAAAMGRLKIMHVLFSPRIAGSERYCIDLANGQAALGHEVHVVGSHGSPMAAALSPAVTFHGMRTRLFRGFRLRRLARTLGAEIGHGHLSPGCKALATLPDRITRIATLHVGYKPKQHARMHGLICVNRAQTDRLAGYAGITALIPNWLPDAGEPVPLGLRGRLGLGPGIRIVGSVGRLHKSKGCGLLLSAFMRAAPAEAALVFAGDGPMRAELEAMAKGDPRIHFLGHCGNVRGFLREIDLFVSPSLEETAGLAILEAMREGLPVITTATDGPSEYLQGQPVTFVEIGSADALAAALGQALAPGNIAGLARLCYEMGPFQRSTGIAHVLQFYLRAARRS